MTFGFGARIDRWVEFGFRVPYHSGETINGKFEDFPHRFSVGIEDGNDIWIIEALIDSGETFGEFMLYTPPEARDTQDLVQVCFQTEEAALKAALYV